MSSDPLLSLYHHLPGPVRTMAATARGLYLRSWRYGRDCESLITEARGREQWPLDVWTRWQQARLSEVLHRAVETVPYYRELWRQRRARGDDRTPGVLENWPILEKDIVRASPERFIADEARRRRLYHEHTSGTTGKPIDLFRSRDAVRRLYALSELRERRWHGASVRQRWAILGGQLVAPVARRQPPFWVWNAALNQLYMSSYHLAPDLAVHYLDALARYRVQYLWGYSSALHALAQETIRLKRRDLRMTVAITNAEPLYSYQRDAIAEAFQCPVRETYGLAELVMAASECEAGSLHLWPEVGMVEVAGGPSGAMRVGDLVATGLLNDAMPLIRYRTGDRGAIAPSGQTCGCGRTLPLMAAIEGRDDDVLYSADGRRVGRLDPVFKARLPVREAQIIQESVHRIRVRFVAGPGFGEDTAATIRNRLRDRLGPVDVEFEAVSVIPRSARGKFRAVICSLPEEERRRLGAA